MKSITYYLSWPMTDDLAAVLTNLSWEHKFELSVALAQTALDEKQNQEAWDRIQVLEPTATLPPKAIEPSERPNETPT